MRSLALQRYCKRVMGDVDKIIHDAEGDAHERYIEMYKIVQDSDKKLAHMFDCFSRSKALDQLVIYYGNDLLSDEEISQFSDETQERIHTILKLWKELKSSLLSFAFKG